MQIGYHSELVGHGTKQCLHGNMATTNYSWVKIDLGNNQTQRTYDT